MKIKLDFITNSSSASFLIAIKKDYSKDQFRQSLSGGFDKLFEILSNQLYFERDLYNYTGEEVSNLSELTRNGWETFCYYITEELYRDIMRQGIELDNWKVLAGECSDVDGLQAFFLYACLNKVTTPDFVYKTIK